MFSRKARGMVRPCVMVPMGVRVSLEAKMPLEAMVLLKDESTWGVTSPETCLRSRRSGSGGRHCIGGSVGGGQCAAGSVGILGRGHVHGEDAVAVLLLRESPGLILAGMFA